MKTITKQPEKIEYHRIIMNTQFHENYGAHDWDGNGTCPQYWKTKGGEEHLVSWFHKSHYGLAGTTLDRILSVFNNTPKEVKHQGDKTYKNVSGIVKLLTYLEQISPFNFTFPSNAFVCDDYSREYPIGFYLVEPMQLTPMEKRDNEMNLDGYSDTRWVMDIEPVQIAV